MCVVCGGPADACCEQLSESTPLQPQYTSVLSRSDGAQEREGGLGVKYIFLAILEIILIVTE